MRTFAQRRGTPDLAAYGARLKADKEELDAFLDRVTINVSHLWRHEDQWTALGKTILPELGRPRGRVRCWSAGSSYGAEAFTLAAIAARSRSRTRGSRSTAPTSTGGWSRAPAPARSRPRTPAPPRRRC